MIDLISIGGTISGFVLIGSIVAKVVTRNNITWKDGKKEFQTKAVCDVQYKGLKEHIDIRFEDMKDFIRNGNK